VLTAFHFVAWEVDFGVGRCGSKKSTAAFLAFQAKEVRFPPPIGLSQYDW